MKPLLLVFTALLAFSFPSPLKAENIPVQGPSAPDFINTWLVLGPYDNDASNSGFKQDAIGESTVTPKPGDTVGTLTWKYFDDRLFSRNYDDYQDLYSYYHLKLNGSATAKVVYAHTYVFSPSQQQLELRVGADTECQVWLNGASVSLDGAVNWRKDSGKASVTLLQGWNRILVKVANQEAGRFGFYLRLCTEAGKSIPDLSYSVAGPISQLAIVTGGMDDVGTKSMPTGWREWSYIGAYPQLDKICAPGDTESVLRSFNFNSEIMMRASDFIFEAGGGTPPYRWTLAGRSPLPPGLSLQPDGRIRGVIADYAELKSYTPTVHVIDAEGNVAEKKIEIEVKERPNKWYEESRLVALSHSPERIPENGYEEFARLTKAQGYQLIMPISWNNGDAKFRWPSIYAPDQSMEDVDKKFKTALEGQGIRFGMYMGNLNIPGAQFSPNAQGLMVEDAIRRYHPAALWFDWAGLDGEGLDALYSMIKVLDPDLVILLNGHIRGTNGDWDELCFEGFGAWGENMWAIWPVDFPWPKKNEPESWRLLVAPKAPAVVQGESDWQEYMRVQMSLIGEGFVANIDDTAMLDEGSDRLTNLSDSYLVQAHQKMAEWASPKGLPPLYPSYTLVNPGPLPVSFWGYNTVNLKRDTIYLHVMKNSRGKTGMPSDPTLTINPVDKKVKTVTWMNANKPLTFTQNQTQTDHSVTIDVSKVQADPIDTILKIELAEPLPGPQPPPPLTQVPPGNLASFKPANLLSLDGKRSLGPSGTQFARYGVDGKLGTAAAAGGEYDWTYEVDLQQIYQINRIVVHFSEKGFPTLYEVQISPDKIHWHRVAGSQNNKGGDYPSSFTPAEAQYVRVRGLKPDGPGQLGGQMAISELEVYEAQ